MSDFSNFPPYVRSVVLHGFPATRLYEGGLYLSKCAPNGLSLVGLRCQECNVSRRWFSLEAFKAGVIVCCLWVVVFHLQLYTWGSGYHGQLALGTRQVQPTPSIVNKLLSTQQLLRKVFCGSHHCAAITTDGELYTWGSNRTGCLGRTLPGALLIDKCGAGLSEKVKLRSQRLGLGLGLGLGCGRRGVQSSFWG